MKKIIPILLLTICSCNNHNKLVYLKLQVQDSVNKITSQWLQDQLKLARPLSERNAEDSIMKIKIDSFKRIIDSIDKELKKE